MMKAKKNEPMVNVNIRISSELRKRFDEAERVSGQNLSDLLRRALDIGMDEMELVGFDVERVYKSMIAHAKEALAKKQVPSIQNPKILLESQSITKRKA